MSDNIHENCENYKVCREYSEFDDRKLARKWSN